MLLETSAVLALAAQCAPWVAPHTIASIVDAESSNYTLAINVNGLSRQPSRPRSASEAIAVAQRYVSRGHSVDMGLGQINSRNMDWLGLTWESVFDPCTNVAAAGTVLSHNYRSVQAGRSPQAALRIALSMYNTGSQSRGFRNGYVARVERAGQRIRGHRVSAPPAIGAEQPIRLLAASYDTADAPQAIAGYLSAEAIAAENIAAAPPPPPPSWDVFAQAAHRRAGGR